MLRKEDAIRIVDEIFPNENFFSFKFIKEKDNPVKFKKEFSEIQRIHQQSVNHGSYYFYNQKEALLVPILMSKDCKDQIVK